MAKPGTPGMIEDLHASNSDKKCNSNIQYVSIASDRMKLEVQKHFARQVTKANYRVIIFNSSCFTF
jgi:hypothetical protein